MRVIQDERAIVSVLGLIMIMILLMVFAYMTPLLSVAITTAKACITDTMTNLLLDSMNFFIVLGIIVSWLIYAGATR